jgi:drug/metabolite transporter (DMT)-like permease
MVNSHHMSIPAIILLLVSASLHALWNFILKRSDDKYIAMGWQVIFGGVFAFLLMLIVGLPPRTMWMFALVSMLIEAIYFILLSNAYTDNDFSLIYPIARGTAPAFIMLWSMLFLHEELTARGMIGIGLIVCGMITIGATSLIQNRGSRLHFKGITLALTVALMISFYTLVDGAAVQNGPPLSYGLLMFTLVPFPTTIFNLRRYGWKRFASVWNGPLSPIILAGVLGVTAYLMALFAYTIAPVSYSGAIRQVSVVIGAFLGWQFLNERMGGMRVIGAFVIFTGILMITIFG